MAEEKGGWDYISALKETHTIIAMTVDLTYVSSQGALHFFSGGSCGRTGSLGGLSEI